MSSIEIIVVGNLIPPKGMWESKQCGRIYSPKGVAPTLCSNRLIREGVQILMEYD